MAKYPGKDFDPSRREPTGDLSPTEKIRKAYAESDPKAIREKRQAQRRKTRGGGNG